MRRTGFLIRPVLLLSSLFGILLPASAQIISLFAGVGGAGGYTGDGGPATQAKIYYPYKCITDNSGNIYFADMVNAVIRRVSTTGIITTVAGNGTGGYSGDGGPATAARLQQPIGLALDNAGNLFICDYGKAVVRKVNPAGIISTYAGNGTPGFSGDGGPATAAQLNSIEDVAVDAAGNLYISDAVNARIRKVTPAGIITTIAGTGVGGNSGDGGPALAAKMGFPCGLAVDASGNLYVADLFYRVVRKITPAGLITTFAGTGTAGYSGDGGPATAARFALDSPNGLAVDAAGNVYIADYGNHVIRKVNAAGIISTVAGTGTMGTGGNGGPAAAATLWFPLSVALDNCNNLFITEPYTNQLRKVTNGLPPLINIQPASLSTCSGTATSFTVQAANATGYQWMVNTGTAWTPLSNTSGYSGALTNSLQISLATVAMNGYQYACVVSNACGTITSAAAVLTVSAALSSSLAITTPTLTVCSGTSVTFTAQATNAGGAPIYQWLKNGVNTGTNSPAYTDASLVNGDKVICRLTTSSGCLASATVISNEVGVFINPLPVVPLPSTATLCTGNQLVLDAGSFAAYLWSDGSTGQTLTVMTAATYTVTVTDSNACQSTGTVTVRLVKNPTDFLPGDTSFCLNSVLLLKASRNYSTYLWSDLSTLPLIAVMQPGTYWLEVEDGNSCKGRDSINITAGSCVNRLYLPTGFTPDGNNKNDVFKPFVSGTLDDYRLAVYNRWGQAIFSSANAASGWDGKVAGQLQQTGVFVWFCTYRFRGEEAKNEKGTVTLIR